MTRNFSYALDPLTVIQQQELAAEHKYNLEHPFGCEDIDEEQLARVNAILEPVGLEEIAVPKVILVRLKQTDPENLRMLEENGVLPAQNMVLQFNRDYILVGELTGSPGHGVFVDADTGEYKVGFHLSRFEIIPPR